MSRWTHVICAECWNARNPERKAVAMICREEEICCYCGRRTTDGLYVRDNPDALPCKGEHPEAA
jgi:hypothetical protein